MEVRFDGFSPTDIRYHGIDNDSINEGNNQSWVEADDATIAT